MLTGQTISHYEVLEKLGGGGMGVVYKAHDTKLNRLVALKFLPPHLSADQEAKKRFVHEAQAASALDHPNICTIYEIGETEEQVFIAMAFYEGETLKRRLGALEPGQRMPEAQAARIVMQLARGLSAAHAKGIVHRDIKPANVMLSDHDMVKIVDFGVAKLSGAMDLTKTGSTLGTAPYMAPEQLRGDKVDARTDLWSLGVLFYELLAGERPFTGDYEQAVTYAILNEPAPALDDVDPGLSAVCMRLLEKDPERRLSSAEQLVRELEAYATGSVDGTFTAPPPPGTAKKSVVIASVAAVVVALIAAGVWLAVREGEPTESHDMVAEKGPDRVMMVVLPFKNLGPADDEYFAAGITEEIISRLGRIATLGVISRTSAFKYQDTDKSIREIADELDVDYVLEGSVRWSRSGDGFSRVRITPTFIQASEDLQLWSDSYDETLEDIFAVQSHIADQVVKQLNLAVSSDESPEAEEIPTRNLEAYQEYLRGIDLIGTRRARSDLDRQKAAESLTRAVSLDPFFAQAWARLSMAHSELYFYGDDRTAERAAKSREALNRALETGPDLPEVRLAEGNFFYQIPRELDRALEAYSIAAEGLPSNADVLARIAWIFRRQGRFIEAVANLEMARKLDPRSEVIARSLGLTYERMGECDKAKSAYDSALEIADDPYDVQMQMAGWYYDCAGDPETALSTYERTVSDEDDLWGGKALFALIAGSTDRAREHARNNPAALWYGQWFMFTRDLAIGYAYYFDGDKTTAKPYLETAENTLLDELKQRPDDFRVHSALAWTAAALGRKEDAIRHMTRATEIMPVEKDYLTGTDLQYILLEIHAIVGNDDEALALIDDLLSRPSLLSKNRLRIHPIFRTVREDPRFEQVLARHPNRE